MVTLIKATWQKPHNCCRVTLHQAELLIWELLRWKIHSLDFLISSPLKTECKIKKEKKKRGQMFTELREWPRVETILLKHLLSLLMKRTKRYTDRHTAAMSHTERPLSPLKKKKSRKAGGIDLRYSLTTPLSFSPPPSTGALPEDHWEERLPGPAVGALHHPERR